MMLILDTTAFSAAMRQEPKLLSFLEQHRPGDISTVPPVIAEIEYGIHRFDPFSKKFTLLREQQERLLKLIRVLAWNPESSVMFGKIKSELEKAGTPIDDFDVAIAAITMAHDAELVTANLVHFRRVEGLSSRHWEA